MRRWNGLFELFLVVLNELLVVLCVMGSWVPHSHHTLRGLSFLLQHRFFPSFSSVRVSSSCGRGEGGADPKPGSGICSQTFLCRVSTSPPPLPAPHLLLVHNCSLCLQVSKSRLLFLHPQSSPRLYPRFLFLPIPSPYINHPHHPTESPTLLLLLFPVPKFP